MNSDRLIDRYVRKLKNSGVEKMLSAAGETMDPDQLFESAHAMKGVCANLGLEELAAQADAITEEFRPGNNRKLTDEEVKEKLHSIAELFEKTLSGIEQYENS